MTTRRRRGSEACAGRPSRPSARFPGHARRAPSSPAGAEHVRGVSPTPAAPAPPVAGGEGAEARRARDRITHPPRAARAARARRRRCWPASTTPSSGPPAPTPSWPASPWKSPATRPRPRPAAGSRARADAGAVTALMAVYERQHLASWPPTADHVANGQLCRIAVRRPPSSSGARLDTARRRQRPRSGRPSSAERRQADVRLALDLLTPNSPAAAERRLALHEPGDRNGRSCSAFPARRPRPRPGAGPARARRAADLVPRSATVGAGGRRQDQPAEDAAPRRSPALPPETIDIMRAACATCWPTSRRRRSAVHVGRTRTCCDRRDLAHRDPPARAAGLAPARRCDARHASRAGCCSSAARRWPTADGWGEPPASRPRWTSGRGPRPPRPATLLATHSSREALLGPTLRPERAPARATASSAMVQDRVSAPSALSPRRTVAAARIARARPRTRRTVPSSPCGSAADAGADRRGASPTRSTATRARHHRPAPQRPRPRRPADHFLDRCRSLPPGSSARSSSTCSACPPGAFAPKLSRVTAAAGPVPAPRHHDPRRPGRADRPRPRPRRRRHRRLPRCRAVHHRAPGRHPGPRRGSTSRRRASWSAASPAARPPDLRERLELDLTGSRGRGASPRARREMSAAPSIRS